MAVTIKEIAGLAGVSVSTVSRIINNKDGFISQATRDKVMRIIEEQGYVPNAFARSLVTRQSKILGLLLPDILNPYFTELMRGCADCAQQRGYSLFMGNSDDDLDKELQYLDFFAEKGVDGILLASGGNDLEEKHLQNNKLPIVTLNRQLPPCDRYVGAISVNDRLGVRLAAAYLLEQGHRAIAFLCGAKQSYMSRERYAGYCQAFDDAGVPVAEELVHFGQYLHKFGYDKTKELLRERTFTAMCCMSDLLAMGAMQALREQHIRIPSQCAVLGYDDIFISRLLEKPLSTVHRHTYDVGWQGTELLIAHIENISQGFVERTFAPHLVLRMTT